jgi:hypothetical protein
MGWPLGVGDDDYRNCNEIEQATPLEEMSSTKDNRNKLFKTAKKKSQSRLLHGRGCDGACPLCNSNNVCCA